TAEDASNLAFAGLFTSILGLNSEAGALKAIRKVADSKRSTKAVHYARQQGIKLGRIGMGIIVQRLINPKYSGVAFSRHPVTDEEVVVIESTYGLCNTLVDGSVTPDYIELAKNGDINEIKIGTKKIKSLFRNNGVVTMKATKSERESLAIPKNIAKSLAGIVRRIERDFGSPQDIEWAVSGKTIYILQTRPITTIK
ncbi:MAG: PEP/pyruvate-binding domain-containing protein, partial [Candidatus Micrarchaeota archaeon]|nr:PEP/pyruvate-binding domain-containing protein [Candidatus Micrarchaeota archaeon]